MNYTYLPTTPFSPNPTPTIILTTPPTSTKTGNLASNPLVSLLVHDWVSHRPPTLGDSSASNAQGRRAGSPPPSAARSSLASLLLGMNTAALSRISVTLNGEAEILRKGSEEEKWCKARHIENNTFNSQEQQGGGGAGTGLGEGIFGGGVTGMGGFGGGGGRGEDSGDGGTGCYVEDEDAQVVVVRIKEGRIADWRGEVRDFAVGEGVGRGTLTNGV